MKDHIQVVIPAFNEVNSLEKVLDALPLEIQGIPVQALVVDDGSTDGTPELARQMGAEIISLGKNRGQGAAIAAGMRAAAEHGCQFCVCLDADGQHDPRQIEEILQPILHGRADFVLGSRFRGVNDSNDTERMLGIRFLSLLVSILLWQRITDATNGFRAIRREYLSIARTLDERFNSIELLIRAKKLRLRIAEVPVRISRRTSGHTKKPRLRYFFGLVKAMIRGVVS